VLLTKNIDREDHFSITAFVLVAVITLQFARAWLEYALDRESPLLGMDKL